MRKRRGLIGALALCCAVANLGGTVESWASSEAIRESVETVIRMRHPTDTREWWLGLGAEAPQVIISLYGAPEYANETLHRARLLQGLAWFKDDPKAVDFLKRQASETPENVIRQAAIQALAVSQGAREEEFISKFLKDPEPHTRVTAAEALKKMKSSAAQKKLEAWYAEESHKWAVERVKNERPPAAGGPQLVASSEQRLNAELAGTWRGFWIYARPGAAKGLNQRPAVLEVQLTPPSAQLTLNPDPEAPKGSEFSKRRVEKLRITGKGNYLTGAMAPETDSEIPLSGEANRRAGIFFLQLRLDAIGTQLLLRHD